MGLVIINKLVGLSRKLGFIIGKWEGLSMKLVGLSISTKCPHFFLSLNCGPYNLVLHTYVFISHWFMYFHQNSVWIQTTMLSICPTAGCSRRSHTRLGNQGGESWDVSMKQTTSTATLSHKLYIRISQNFSEIHWVKKHQFWMSSVFSLLSLHPLMRSVKLWSRASNFSAHLMPSNLVG